MKLVSTATQPCCIHACERGMASQVGKRDAVDWASSGFNPKQPLSANFILTIPDQSETTATLFRALFNKSNLQRQSSGLANPQDNGKWDEPPPDPAPPKKPDAPSVDWLSMTKFSKQYRMMQSDLESLLSNSYSSELMVRTMKVGKEHDLTISRATHSSEGDHGQKRYPTRGRPVKSNTHVIMSPRQMRSYSEASITKVQDMEEPEEEAAVGPPQIAHLPCCVRVDTRAFVISDIMKVLDVLFEADVRVDQELNLEEHHMLLDLVTAKIKRIIWERRKEGAVTCINVCSHLTDLLRRFRCMATSRTREDFLEILKGKMTEINFLYSKCWEDTPKRAAPLLLVRPSHDETPVLEVPQQEPTKKVAEPGPVRHVCLPPPEIVVSEEKKKMRLCVIISDLIPGEDFPPGFVTQSRNNNKGVDSRGWSPGRIKSPGKQRIPLSFRQSKTHMKFCNSTAIAISLDRLTDRTNPVYPVPGRQSLYVWPVRHPTSYETLVEEFHLTQNTSKLTITGQHVPLMFENVGDEFRDTCEELRPTRRRVKTSHDQVRGKQNKSSQRSKTVGHVPNSSSEESDMDSVNLDEDTEDKHFLENYLQEVMRRKEGRLRRKKAPNRLCYICSDASPLVAEVLEDRGWEKVYHATSEDWNIHWDDYSVAKDILKNHQLKQSQHISHFETHSVVLSKFSLLMCLKEYQLQLNNLSPKLLMDMVDFFPPTFAIPQEYCQLMRYMSKNPGYWWILRPAVVTGRKKIFHIFQNPGEVRRIPKTMTCSCPDCRPHNDRYVRRKKPSYIVQRYIENPMLIGRRKFHMTLYVMVESYYPLKVWVYREGLAHYAGARYTQRNLRYPQAHITDPEFPKEGLDESEKKKLQSSLSEIRTVLTNMSDKSWNVDELMHRVHAVVVNVLLSLRADTSKKTRQSFALYTFDVMLDKDKKPWFLSMKIPTFDNLQLGENFLQRAILHDCFNILDLERKYRTNKSANRIGGFDLIWRDGPVPCVLTKQQHYSCFTGTHFMPPTHLGKGIKDRVMNLKLLKHKARLR